MINLNFVIIIVIFILENVSNQKLIDDPCILQSSGSPGVCKLLTHCQHARNEVVNFQRLPQTCGFQETQPIVCCPTGGKREPGEVSKLKCKQYSSYASEKSTPNQCIHKIVKSAVGGEQVSREEFPHMAAIGFELNPGEIQWLCSGSIISERYILTAAYCLREFPVIVNSDIAFELYPKYVQVGISSHQQTFNIVSTIYEPNEYEQFSPYHDIGLIRVRGAINFNSYVRPACLYTETEIRTELAIATGWGLIKDERNIPSNDLQKVTLNFISHEICNMTYGNKSLSKFKNGIVNKIQVCAGLGDEKKDTCRGLAGTPLQIYHEGDDIKCMYDLVGIGTSFGKRCSGDPGVYTRISHYVKWIENIVWRKST